MSPVDKGVFGAKPGPHGKEGPIKHVATGTPPGSQAPSAPDHNPPVISPRAASTTSKSAVPTNKAQKQKLTSPKKPKTIRVADTSIRATIKSLPRSGTKTVVSPSGEKTKVPRNKPITGGVFQATKAKQSPTPEESDLLNYVLTESDMGATFNSQQARQNEKAIDYYYGERNGSEVPGQSQVVSRSVMEAIEDTMPILMRMFVSTESLGIAVPQNLEDEEEAEQATDYVNYNFWRQNEGYNLIHDFAKDGLLQKKGVFKVWFDSEGHTEISDYENITLEQFQAYLVDNVDSEIEILEHEIFEDESGLKTVNFTAKQKWDQKNVIEVIPPEEFLISQNATDIESALFVGQKTRMTRSELEEMLGGEVDIPENAFSGGGSRDPENSNEKLARNRYDTTQTFNRDPNTNDKSIKSIVVIEAYPKFDFDGDGVAERRHVLVAGNKLLINEPTDNHPFITWSPIRIPHKHTGLSLADQTVDIQEVSTTILRNSLDNMYLTNNTQKIVVEGQVNIDDLLQAKPGGIIRTKTLNAIQPLITPPLPPETFGLLEYMDRMKMNRTGTNGAISGVDADSVKTHVTQFGASQNLTQSQGHIELIARNLAEAIRQLFQKAYENIVKHESKQQVIKLRGSWTTVNPSEWKQRRNFRVEVGLGYGNKDQNLIHLQTILQVQNLIGGVKPAMVSPQELFNAGQAVIDNTGLGDAEKFIRNPAKISPEEMQGPPPPPTKEQVELEKLELDKQIAGADFQLKQAEIQLKAQEQNIKAGELQLKAQMAGAKLELEFADLQLDAQELQWEMDHPGQNISSSKN